MREKRRIQALDKLVLKTDFPAADPQHERAWNFGRLKSEIERLLAENDLPSSIEWDGDSQRFLLEKEVYLSTKWVDGSGDGPKKGPFGPDGTAMVVKVVRRYKLDPRQPLEAEFARLEQEYRRDDARVDCEPRQAVFVLGGI